MKALEPTLDYFKNSFVASALSTSTMIANNQSTNALPKETERINLLLRS